MRNTTGVSLCAKQDRCRQVSLKLPMARRGSRGRKTRLWFRIQIATRTEVAW